MFLTQSVDERDQQVQGAMLELSKRTGNRTRKNGSGKRARHAKRAEEEGAGLSRSKKRARRKASAKKKASVKIPSGRTG